MTLSVMIPKLSRIEKIDLRKAFASEAGSFTPWLAQEENLQLLGRELGLDLEFVAREKNVGPFSADLLCKDLSTESNVLIENQLEKTDHTHLGQVITYAAGLNAKTIVWITKEFTEEHRAAIDWLNENTLPDFNFFGVQIELWQIGTSEIAPKFHVISKPNEWSKSVNQGKQRIGSSDVSETKQIQQKFWQGFAEYLTKNSKILRPTKPTPQHWMNMSIGKSGYKLAAIASFYDSEQDSYESNEVRAELQIDTADAKQVFRELQKDQSAIDAQFPIKLHWHNPETIKSARLFLRQSTNISNESNWPNDYEWLHTHLELLHKVFRPKIIGIE